MVSPIYTHQLDSDEPIMLIDRHIGFDAEDGVGIMGDQFQKELLWLDSLGKKRIQVWINSPGGGVMDGMNIYNAILKTKTKVDTYCMGIAASIAGVIFQAGRKRIMADYSQLMYHNPSGTSTKDSGYNAFRDSLITMICSRTGKEESEVSKMMNRTTWINADEAVASGMCDAVENSNEHNKPRQYSSTDAKAMWKEANLVLNNAFKSNNMFTKEQLALIGLSDTATPDEITNALTDLANKAKAKKVKEVKDGSKGIANDEDVDADVKNQLAAIANTVKEMTESSKALKTELDSMKNKANTTEAAARKVAATELVNKNLDRIGGKAITDDLKNSWIAKAEQDLDGTAKILEALPVNKTKVDIQNSANELPAGTLPTSAIGMMAKVKNDLKKAGYQTYL